MPVFLLCLKGKGILIGDLWFRRKDLGLRMKGMRNSEGIEQRKNADTNNTLAI
jgi:hypothetical protein